MNGKKIRSLGWWLTVLLLSGSALQTGSALQAQNPQANSSNKRPQKPNEITTTTATPVDTAGYVETIQGLKIPMVFVGGGTFEMGATPEQGSSPYADEMPLHTVEISSFYMAKYELTQGVWKAVMGSSVAQLRNSIDTSYALHGEGDNYPIYYVRWEEAQDFCKKLSELTGKKYRLPTEAEWEYAARGGRRKDGTKYAGSNRLSEVAWVYRNSEGTTHPVGQKKPNGLGLYDMSGNVWEWCYDHYCADYYNESPAKNPQGPDYGLFRVKRGGSWRYLSNSGRVSRRYCDFTDTDLVGLRIVCEL